MVDNFDFSAQKKRFDDAVYACLGRQKSCETERSTDRDCFKEFIDCADSAGKEHDGNAIDWLTSIDTYSAITWRGEEATRVNSAKVDKKITLGDLESLDFDGDKKFTFQDGAALMARLRKASFQLHKNKHLQNITHQPPSEQSFQTFKDYLKARAPELYKKAFPKDE